MQLDQLRLLFRVDQLAAARVIANPVGSGWLLEFDCTGGETVTMLKSRPGQDRKTFHNRVFSVIDTAIKTAGEIGFTEVTVMVPEMSVPSPEEFELG